MMCVAALCIAAARCCDVVLMEQGAQCAGKAKVPYRVAEGAPFGAHVNGMRLNNQPALLCSARK